MFHKPVSGLAGIALLLVCAVARSQDFHVSTRINDLNAPPQITATGSRRPPPPALCVSLFHAGKVYDYSDRGSEVSIFEPAQERFLIFNSANRTATVVSFDYINRRLHQAHTRRAEELRRASAAKAEYLAFELHPKFEEEFDAAKKYLKMDSPFFTYQVRCAAADSPELVKKYLDYADWAARLNYASYRQSNLPDARLAVNNRLREIGMLPVQVELKVKVESGPHMKVDHKFTWNLDNDNHQTISYWEEMSTARNVKHLTPDDFFDASSKQANNRR